MAECLEMIRVSQKSGVHLVPCGKCAFCLVSKRSQWMFRIFYEMRKQEHPGWFLTLTYDEKHVKRTADGRLSLRFRDVQLFIKKLRKQKYYVKYICVGEYGSRTKRPHYHLLIWTDCPVESIEKLWGKGQLHVGRITMESAMYTLKYIVQPKQNGVDGIERTRGQFSKGLGLAYLSSSVYDYHTSDYEHPELCGMVDGRMVALPRYYRFKIFTRYQLRLEGFKLALKRHKEKRLAKRAVAAQGVAWGKIAMHQKKLRVEIARRIIKKTKLNEML